MLHPVLSKCECLNGWNRGVRCQIHGESAPDFMDPETEALESEMDQTNWYVSPHSLKMAEYRLRMDRQAYAHYRTQAIVCGMSAETFRARATKIAGPNPKSWDWVQAAEFLGNLAAMKLEDKCS